MSSHSFPFTLEYNEEDEYVAMKDCITKFMETSAIKPTSWPVQFKPFMTPLKKGDWIKVISSSSKWNGVVGIIEETRYVNQEPSGLWYGHFYIKRTRGERTYYFQRHSLIPHEPTEKELTDHLTKRIS